MSYLDFWYFLFLLFLWNEAAYEKSTTSRNISWNIHFENSVVHSLPAQVFNGWYDKLCTIKKFDFCLSRTRVELPVDTGRKLNVLDVFWTSYVRSVYVLCLRGLVVDSSLD